MNVTYKNKDVPRFKLERLMASAWTFRMKSQRNFNRNAEKLSRKECVGASPLTDTRAPSLRFQELVPTAGRAESGQAMFHWRMFQNISTPVTMM